MAATKVSDAELRAYLDAGHTQAAAARRFGVSEPAIHQPIVTLERDYGVLVVFPNNCLKHFT